MDYDAYSFVMDFAFMSLLLVIAQFLRSKVKFLQDFYIPSSVIGGGIGPDLWPAGFEYYPME